MRGTFVLGAVHRARRSLLPQDRHPEPKRNAGILEHPPFCRRSLKHSSQGVRRTAPAPNPDRECASQVRRGPARRARGSVEGSPSIAKGSVSSCKQRRCLNLSSNGLASDSCAVARWTVDPDERRAGASIVSRVRQLPAPRHDRAVPPQVQRSNFINARRSFGDGFNHCCHYAGSLNDLLVI